jgi:hypothetical protein
MFGDGVGRHGGLLAGLIRRIDDAFSPGRSLSVRSGGAQSVDFPTARQKHFLILRGRPDKPPFLATTRTRDDEASLAFIGPGCAASHPR